MRAAPCLASLPLLVAGSFLVPGLVPVPGPVPAPIPGELAFAIQVHGEEELPVARAEELLAAVEDFVDTLWAPGSKAREAAAVDGETGPLPVNLYASYEDYRAADEELTGGTFARNWSFSSWSKSAHVALQPPLGAAALAEIGLPIQTLRLLVHEAAHLALYERLPNYRSHPDWLSEGATQWIESEVLLQAGLVEGREEHPAFAKHIVRAQALLEAKGLPSIEDVVAGGPAEDWGGTWRDGYAVQALLFRFLLERHSARFEEVLQEARSLAGGEGYVADLAKAFEKAFKRKKLDAEFAKWIGKLEPRWDQLYGSLDTEGDAWVQAAFPETNAIAWRTEPIGAKQFAIRGHLTVLPGKKTQMNFLLGRGDDGFLSIALTAGYGVNVFHRDDAADSWSLLAKGEAEGFGVGEEVEFVIQVGKKGDLSVDLNGEEVVEVDNDDIPVDLSGPWGLGAQNGSVGVWREVQVDA